MRTPWTFRAAVLSIFAVIAAVVVAGLIALMSMTAALDHRITEVARADTRMRASLRTKAALLWYARESDLAALQPEPAVLANQAAAERDLLANVDETRRLATPDRVGQLDNLVRKTHAYVALRKNLQRKGLPLEAIIHQATPDVELVFADLQQLVASDDAWARSVEASAQALSSAAELVGVGVVCALVIGFIVAFGRSDRLLQQPVLALSDAIGRFAGGDRKSRARPEGVREIRDIATAFDELADRLVRQERERLEFLGGVAHDLRNPLTPLKLAVGVLATSQSPPPELLANTVAVVRRQVDRIDRMVGDLLDVARIQSGQLDIHRQSVDLRTLVASTADLYRSASNVHEIVVDAPGEPVIASVDPVRIEQVLINLVSNAIKYSPEGGRVTLRLTADRDTAVLSVTDEGIGVPPEERERIFEPFHRTGRSREAIPGVGLGLAVARTIARAHEGTLDVVGETKGSTFRLTLPRSPRLD